MKKIYLTLLVAFSLSNAPLKAVEAAPLTCHDVAYDYAKRTANEAGNNVYRVFLDAYYYALDLCEAYN